VAKNVRRAGGEEWEQEALLSYSLTAAVLTFYHSTKYFLETSKHTNQSKLILFFGNFSLTFFVASRTLPGPSHYLNFMQLFTSRISSERKVSLINYTIGKD
jgi:hypothetical protein